MLVPVIGLVQVGFQSMADRYTYLPLIGVLIGVTFGVGDWVVKRRFKAAILILVAGIVLGGCLFATARQLRFWQDSETLFAHALAVTQGNHVAHNDLGMALLQKGQVDEAIAHFQKAVEIRADYVRALHNLGAALMQRGRVDEAIAPLQKALELEPKYAAAHYTFGTALLKKGRVEEAIAHYQAALEDQPQNVGIANNLAWVLATSPTAPLRNGAKAVELAEQADRLSDSKNPGVIGTLAAAYAEAGRFPEAIAAAERALHLAATQNDAARVDTLKTQIQCYKAGSPFRDNSQTNGLHENPLPQK
jgi:tetratricopeptide (TPR) repeat protein